MDGHWTVGKSFDAFTPLGPVIETKLNPFTAKVEARQNGKKKQFSGTELIIYFNHKNDILLNKVMTLKT